MRTVRFAALPLLLPLLTACGREETAPPAETAPVEAAAEAEAEVAEPELPPLPGGDFRIASISFGTAVDEEGQVLQPLEVFAPGDRIHAAVVTVGSSEGLTLSGRWLAPDGREIARAGQTLDPSTPIVASFSLRQPDPWPPGRYQFQVAINDRVVETRSFEVR
ncbi:hypothetical protein [Arenimonas fontis]|uniref:Uncharacterized protein n=1 Tax=Arenimonas fontis TaxID=2608255 RepID=A0A5B2Z7C8_9GAMM|nr:hypothetical protein [Arenimonas fontis]KAA2284096.1 hypothetical protein F0415_10810 [Arenimonas fontis]